MLFFVCFSTIFIFLFFKTTFLFLRHRWMGCVNVCVCVCMCVCVLGGVVELDLIFEGK